MTTTAGWCCFKAACTASKRISASRCTPSASSPSRCARRATCCADSSPDTYSTLRFFAIRATVCSSSVDLPMPGSPPNKITAPSTSPPPSTRSSSPMPVGSRGTSAAVTLESSCTCVVSAAHDWKRAFFGSGAAMPSCKVFHSPQCGHLPCHLGTVPPHSVQV